MFADEDSPSSSVSNKESDSRNSIVEAGEIEISESTAILNRDPQDGIIIGDLWGYITDVNEVVVKLCGASDKSEIIGKHVLNFIVKEERDRAVQESLKSIANNQERTEKYQILTKNGKIIPVEVNVTFIRDKQGEKIGFLDIVKKL